MATADSPPSPPPVPRRRAHLGRVELGERGRPVHAGPARRHPSPRPRRSGRGRIADAAASADLVVTTYAVLRLEAAAFAALEWGGLVLDEAQFVKNAATKVHEAARGIRAPFRLAVTGTPDREQPRRAVGDAASSSRRGCSRRGARSTSGTGGRSRTTATPSGCARLRRRIRPLMLRRTKEVVAPELPPKQEQVLAVELASEAPAPLRHRAAARAAEAARTHRRPRPQSVHRLPVAHAAAHARARRDAHRRFPLRRLPVGEARRAVRAARRRARRGPPGARVQPVHVVPRQGERHGWMPRACRMRTSTGRRRPAAATR